VNAVHHPDHYNTHPFYTGECWDYLENLPTLRSHAFKYIWRYNDKGTPAQDVHKAIAYLNRADRQYATQGAEHGPHHWATYDNLHKQLQNEDKLDTLSRTDKLAAVLLTLIACPDIEPATLVSVAERLAEHIKDEQ
jgi:hypothetical protein